METAPVPITLGTQKAALPAVLSVVSGAPMPSLGEVTGCQPEADGYMAWAQLVEALHSVDELSRLARALAS